MCERGIVDPAQAGSFGVFDQTVLYLLLQFLS